jgi:ribosomal protein S18 acetylase RimI-like enzyme
MRPPRVNFVEILDLRHFSSADLRPLLQEEADMWSRLLSWDYSGSTEMVLRYLDNKILPGYAAVDRGRVLGYAFFVYEASKGVIGDLFVANGGAAPKDEEIEALLLKHSIETLQQSPGIHRAEAQLLLHGSGRVASSFLENGFRRYPRLFMVADLGRNSEPPAPITPEIEIRPWSENDYQPTAGVITACYRDHVDSEINDQYRSVNGSLRFLHNIVRFPGCGQFDPQSSFVAYNRALRMLVGVILCSRIRHDAGHVTQVCVLPDYRSHGIGDALMHRAAQALRAHGLSLLTLTVTEANEGAVHLYERLGFGTKHIFDAFVWEG